jgi:type I restriction enzyme S subunit
VANTEQGHDCLLIGYAAIVPDAFGSDGLFSHHLYQLRIRKTSPITADFLCRLLNSPRMHEVVSGYGNGTTVNMLQIDGVQHPQFVVPTRALIVAYSDLAAISRAQEAGLLGETRRLVKTRDRLLPKVLSGEVTIQTGRE